MRLIKARAVVARGRSSRRSRPCRAGPGKPAVLAMHPLAGCAGLARPPGFNSTGTSAFLVMNFTLPMRVLYSFLTTSPIKMEVGRDTDVIFIDTSWCEQ